MTRLVRDALGALVIATASGLIGFLIGIVASVEAIEDALDVHGDDEPFGPDECSCTDCDASIEALIRYLDARAARAATN